MLQIEKQPADGLRTRKIELILQQLESLPTLPAIAMRLVSVAGKSDTKIEEIVSLLSADPALTAKILSLVSSAAAGVRKPVTTVHQAVVLLGFETVRNLALSVKIFEVFPQSTPGTTPAPHEFDRTGFWKHSLAVATAAEMLAARCHPALSPQDAFVCGLLHDLGKVALDAVMPKSYARAVEVATMTRGDIADAERRELGLDHLIAGKRVAETWSFPTLITQCIWLHATPPMMVPQGVTQPAIVQLVGLADSLVRRLHIGFSGNFLYAFEARQYLDPLGLTENDLAGVSEKLAENLEMRAKAIGLYDVHSKQIYLQSIANANAELGRVNQAVASQNRHLAQRSECFELLTRFYQHISPTAAPGHLLKEIAATAHDYFQSDQLVLFSQDTDETTGEVLLFDHAAGVQENFLMTMPAFGGDQRLGRGNDFIRPAAPQLNWLLERAEHFTQGRRWSFMPLLCGGHAVGGLLWPEKAGLLSTPMLTDLALVSESWGVTLRSAQIRQRHDALAEALAASNRELAVLQQQFVRTKSLANLGEMAAGAAHEMNNPLAVICGRAQLLAAKLQDSQAKQDAQLIAQQGQRLSEMISDLMEFAKPVAPKLESRALEPLLREAVVEAQERPGSEKHPIKIECPRDLPMARVDAGQIRSALAEIILNAIQATSASAHKKGDIFIQVRQDTLDERLIIQVTDLGIGMSDQTLRQAFAPFFSAKTAGRQRGMGLAKALRWIELHNGTVRLDSAPLQGTTAVIILPMQLKEPQTPTAPEAVLAAAAVPKM